MKRDEWVGIYNPKKELFLFRKGVTMAEIKNDAMYRQDEIKYNIDTCIQQTMYETIENKEESWKIILELQSKLYETFDIEE